MHTTSTQCPASPKQADDADVVGPGLSRIVARFPFSSRLASPSELRCDVPTEWQAGPGRINLMLGQARPWRTDGLTRGGDRAKGDADPAHVLFLAAAPEIPADG